MSVAIGNREIQGISQHIGGPYKIHGHAIIRKNLEDMLRLDVVQRLQAGEQVEIECPFKLIGENGEFAGNCPEHIVVSFPAPQPPKATWGQAFRNAGASVAHSADRAVHGVCNMNRYDVVRLGVAGAVGGATYWAATQEEAQPEGWLW